jgi:tetraacyldisaccharide 4'-kinase
MRRLALYPLALLYGAVIWLRNRCFDLQLFKTQPIAGKSICVGNLAVGGTGKSPHVAYIIELLCDLLPIQVLSRGYGRNTAGYLELTKTTTASQVGDESKMLYELYQNKAQFAVCENRFYGIQQLRSQKPNSLILLDDAFQHRHVKAGLNIVLSVFDQPMHQDFLLPAGRLREPMSGLCRADAVVITKCPKFDTFDDEQYAKTFQKWQIPVFFSRYTYRELQSLGKFIHNVQEVLIVSGIALPQQLNEAFASDIQIRHKSYSDHHVYTAANLEEIHHFFDTFATANTAIVTTAKDWVKIQSLLNPKDLQKYPWYLLTFELEWLDQTAFNQFISAYVVSN